MTRLNTLLALLLFIPAALGSHHSWRMNEAYSNADGSIQFIEMQSNVDGHEKMTCCQMVAGNLATGVDTAYSFPQNLPSAQTGGRKMLIATAGFEAAHGIRPDYIIPDGFLATGPGDVFYNDTLSWNALPTDGVNSFAPGNVVTAATPTNFNGEQTTLQASNDSEPPTLQGVPSEALVIASNTDVPNTDARIVAIQSAITCTDNIDSNPNVTFDLALLLIVDSTTDMTITCTDASSNTDTATLAIIIESFEDTDNDGISNLEDDDDDNDGRPDSNDAFPLDPTETTDTDGDGIGNNADDDDDGNGIPDDEENPDGADNDGDGIDDSIDTDDDNDNIPDDVELANGLDPLLADDADNDNDGDGLTNAEEFALGKDINQDDVPPVISLTSPLDIDATGRLTTVSLNDVSAIDVKDGAVDVSPNQTGPFGSGRQVIIWQATDAAGNKATREQTLNIKPLIGIQADQIVAEGNQAKASFTLSGPAPEYPVTITYKSSGEATEADFSPLSTTKIVPAGESFDIVFNTIADGITEGEEHFYITLVSADHAVIGENDTHTLIITEDNVAPNVTIDINQANEARARVTSTDGDISVTAVASDPNLDDALTYDWSETDDALGLDQVAGSSASIVASDLAPGIYKVVVKISDNAANQATTTRQRSLFVLADLPILNANDDSDGDGIDDVAEGHSDNDKDGLPAYLDNNDASHLVATATNDQSLETTAGLRLGLGEAAMFTNATGATITRESFDTWVNQMPDAADSSDLTHTFESAIFDFEIAGLTQQAQRAQVVLPLTAALPTNTVYRKYNESSGWQNFAEDATNAIASAPGNTSTCPPAGSSLYEPGLIAGSFCVQLTLTDGGVNDRDALPNQLLVDPGVFAVADTTPPEGSAPASITITTPGELDRENPEIQDFLNAATCVDSLAGELEVSNDAPSTFPWPGTTTVNFSCTDLAGNTTSFTGDVTLQGGVTPGGVSGSSSGSGCFIATAAYGSWLSPEVTLLRQFRDDQLLTNKPGKRFVQAYYQYSPPIADVIAEQPLLAAIARAALAPLVYSVKYPAFALASLLLLLALFCRRLIKR